MENNLQSYIRFFKTAFKNNKYRTAHQIIKEKMVEMAKDKEILFEIIRQNLSKPGFFSQKRINPVIALDIFNGKDFSIVAHCWVPLPDRATNITHQSVHHHGRLLLTSVAPLGDGYESVLFKQGYELDREKGIANMQIGKIYKNPQYNIEFIDNNTPHVVFYPTDFAITYALWSYDKKDGIIALLRRSKLMQANKKIIIGVLKKLGIAKTVGVNVVDYFDFYPDGGSLRAMKERVMYPVGSHENFVHHIFYILYKTGFNDKPFLDGLKKTLSSTELAAIEKPMTRFLNNEVLEDRFDPAHLNIAKINFTKEELLKCFGQNA